MKPINILGSAYSKMMLYIHEANGEISGLGIVNEHDGTVMVTDVYLLGQQCSGASTEIDPSSIGVLVTKLVKDGIDTSLVKLWWHSHDTMDVFWSGTDTKTIEDWTKDGRYLLSIVGNKKNKTISRIDIFKPYRAMIDNIPLAVIPNYSQAGKDYLKKLIDDEKYSEINSFISKAEMYYSQEEIKALKAEVKEKVRPYKTRNLSFNGIGNHVYNNGRYTDFEDENLFDIIAANDRTWHNESLETKSLEIGKKKTSIYDANDEQTIDKLLEYHGNVLHHMLKKLKKVRSISRTLENIAFRLDLYIPPDATISDAKNYFIFLIEEALDIKKTKIKKEIHGGIDGKNRSLSQAT